MHRVESSLAYQAKLRRFILDSAGGPMLSPKRNVAECLWNICFLGLLASVKWRFIAVRYKFKRSTYIQEPLVIGGVEYRERFKREKG
jgi:hypothetical protein